MKYILIIILTLIVHFNAFSQHKTSDEIIGDFKVNRIERIEDNYIIYATHLDTLYKIVSQKTFKNSAKKMKKGGIYKLHLVSYFKNIPLTCINAIEVSPVCYVRWIDETKQLYFCMDISGLYLKPSTHLYHNLFFLVDYPSISGDFTIKKIRLKNSVYIIDAVKDSITYRIASPKTLCSNNKLKIDSTYYMQLSSYFEKVNNFARIIDGAVEVRPKTLIEPNPITGQLYFSFDIISNCYIRPNRFSKE